MGRSREEFVAGRDFAPDEIELLAKLEHIRWCAEKWLAGWEYEPVRDVANKKHPDLQPWNALPNREQKIDDSLVSSIQAALRERTPWWRRRRRALGVVAR